MEQIIDLVFTKFMPYLAPILFIILAFWIADEIISLLYKVWENRRRGDYH